ncbi:MAG TPA: uridine diphosphate-N-acetylglucosamine-binding protein YvcK, partial [Candidatus Omnitrophota bacterium]|nr:uridine diphosphate-N-acetylglucosamine-binding protein YvcK [Candidatus Omnitrophota bacterium]
LDFLAGRYSEKKIQAYLKRLCQEQYRVICIATFRGYKTLREYHKLGVNDHILKPFSPRELVLRVRAMIERRKRMACLGGGTGLFTLLTALKTIPGILLTSIVNMSDDGGSSGRLRSSFGVLPPGDIRRSLVALSNAPAVMNELMRYRFVRGQELEDHSVGNLLLTALSEIKGSMAEAVRSLGDILNVQGVVLPISKNSTRIVAEFEDGTVIRGESLISEGKGRVPSLKIRKIWHEPEAVCEPNAYASLLHADLILIGPGDLYTSVITNLVIPEVQKALVKTPAKKAYLCNLMTKPGETAHFDAAEHVRSLVVSFGRDILDYVIVSNTRFSQSAVARYAKLGQRPVLAGRQRAFREITRAKVILADIGHDTILVRHDESKLRRHIIKLLAQISRAG